jgi:hypothetical protein
MLSPMGVLSGMKLQSQFGKKQIEDYLSFGSATM